jgi:NADH-quinone oxidoreductase subunit L
MTHAFFKALLFLGSGSVIHAMGGEQDIRKMGGLKKFMPATHITFLIGCLAISGFPFLSGFFSKDEILAAAYANNPVIYFCGLAGAMMTAYYMFRLYMLTFQGTFRGTHEQEHHLHESPAAITIPLIVLAILSVVGGFVGMPEVFSEHHYLGSFLGNVVTNGETHHLDHNTELGLMGLSTVLALVMMVVGIVMNKKPKLEENTGLGKVLENKWYVDELYDAVIVRPLTAFSRFADRVIEKMGIDGLVNGVGKLVKIGSDRIRMLQSGQVGFYIFIMVLGMIILFALSFFWIH